MGSSRLLSTYPSAAKQQVLFEVCGTRNLIPVSTPWPSDVEVNLLTRCWVLKWRRRFKQGSSISTTRCSVFTTSCFISAVSSLIRWEGIDSAGTVTPVDAEELVQRGTMPAKPTLPAHESQFVSPAWAWKSLPSWARLQAKASFWDCQTHSLGMLFMYYYVVMSIDDIIASVRCCLVTCMWE